MSTLAHTGVPIGRARRIDLMRCFVSPDIYRAFVLEAGWPPNQWISWTSALTARELFRS
jgi:hypothetical protein